MLKITTEPEGEGVRLRLEGDLAGTGVQVLEEFWGRTGPSYAGRPVCLDLSGVARVDDAGKYILALIHGCGAGMVSTGIETRALLDSIARDWPPAGAAAAAPRRRRR